jgi:hypothetical protein
MVEEKEKPRRRMQDLGYKALTTFVKQAVYHAMDRCTTDEAISHSGYLRRLIEADLVRKGYLPGALPRPASRKK